MHRTPQPTVSNDRALLSANCVRTRTRPLIFFENCAHPTRGRFEMELCRARRPKHPGEIHPGASRKLLVIEKGSTGPSHNDGLLSVYSHFDVRIPVNRAVGAPARLRQSAPRQRRCTWGERSMGSTDSPRAGRPHMAYWPVGRRTGRCEVDDPAIPRRGSGPWSARAPGWLVERGPGGQGFKPNVERRSDDYRTVVRSRLYCLIFR